MAKGRSERRQRTPSQTPVISVTTGYAQRLMRHLSTCSTSTLILCRVTSSWRLSMGVTDVQIEPKLQEIPKKEEMKPFSILSADPSQSGPKG